MNLRRIAALACVGLLTTGIHSVALAKKPLAASGEVTFYTVQQLINVTPSTQRSDLVSCEEGDVVISGGYTINPSPPPSFDVFVKDTYPAADPNDPTGAVRHWVFVILNANTSPEQNRS
jgi:hypothetical protein